MQDFVPVTLMPQIGSRAIIVRNVAVSFKAMLDCYYRIDGTYSPKMTAAIIKRLSFYIGRWPHSTPCNRYVVSECIDVFPEGAKVLPQITKASDGGITKWINANLPQQVDPGEFDISVEAFATHDDWILSCPFVFGTPCSIR